MPPSDNAIPHRILVVDHLPALKATARTLRQAGYEVEQAANAVDALRRAKDARPGLILLQVGLPDLPAWDLVRQIRADPTTSGISAMISGSM